MFIYTEKGHDRMDKEVYYGVTTVRFKIILTSTEFVDTCKINMEVFPIA